MAENSSSISVYDYTSYREFLADYYSFRKKRNPSFSYRGFAARAGISSSGLYKEVVDGKRGLSRTLISRFAKALKLGRRETDYFENMVYFNDARTVEERKHYFSKMMESYESRARKIHGRHYEYFSEWYCAVIRELLALDNPPSSARELARACSPSIRPDQAEKALRIMAKLGLIETSSDGTCRRKDPVLTARAGSRDPEIHRLNLINFQQAMLRRAEQAFDRHAPEAMDMSTLTLSVSEETFGAIKEELALFRKKLLTLAARDEHPDRVYQLNQHLFPVGGTFKGKHRQKKRDSGR